MSKHTNTPELRFPGFEDEWIYKDFDDCIKIKTKLVDPRLDKYQNLPHIGPANIEKNTGKILSYKLVKAENLVSGKFHFNENDIIYGKINPQLQKICLHQFEGLSSADAYPLSCLDVFNKFIYYSLFTQRFYKYSVSVSMRTGMPKINREELKNFKFVIPSYAEQKEIGDFFSKLDQQIELEEKKLELLEQQKKGYMQKIFSQELRFKDENGNDYPDWKLKKLSNIADIIGGGTPSTKKSEYWDGDINWFSPVEIGDKEFVSTSQRRITEKGLEKSSAKMLPIGTVLFTSRAGIGKTAILSKEATTNQGFQSIVPKENDLDSYFLYSMTSILKRNAEKVGAGSTFSEVSRKQMEQIKLLIPILKEQKQIGRLFQIINRKINKQIHKIELLKQRKKGLLQKMFV